MFDIVEKARIYATAAHAAVGQKRKYTFEPYIVHPADVVEIVKTIPHTEAMLAAAWLHDVVEDTHITLSELRDEFAGEIYELVYWLTNVSKPSDGNRAVRKELDRIHLSTAPAEAQTIKLADLISNTRTILIHDPDFAKVYVPEKISLIETMDKGDISLRKRAMEMLQPEKKYHVSNLMSIINPS